MLVDPDFEGFYAIIALYWNRGNTERLKELCSVRYVEKATSTSSRAGRLLVPRLGLLWAFQVQFLSS